MPAASTDAHRRLRAAIVVSARWQARPELASLDSTLRSAGVKLDVVASLEDALGRLAEPGAEAECVILDGSAAAEVGGARAPDFIAAGVRRLRHARPGVPVLVVTRDPPAPLVAAAFRVGAADVIDLASGDDLAILRGLERASSDHAQRLAREARIAELRQVVDEFLRVLVKSERRTFELEDVLSPEEAEPEADQPPCVLIVDDEQAIIDLLEDMLARAGLAAVSATTGEEAVRTLQTAADSRARVDIALVDKNLPAMDGLATIRALREIDPTLPTMIMTGYSSADSAVAAADIGVVGYVLKPFSDVRELTDRVKELAVGYAASRRERRFLARIKRRHAQFLERYRKIVAELDKLKE